MNEMVSRNKLLAALDSNLAAYEESEEWYRAWGWNEDADRVAHKRVALLSLRSSLENLPSVLEVPQP